MVQVKKIEKDGYRLHLIKNKNFKTVFVKLLFWDKIKEDDITLRNVLFNNLLFSNEQYKTSREMAIKKGDLYGLNIIPNITRRSNYIFNTISLSIIEEKYTEPGLLKNSLEFLFSLLSNPNLDNNSFNKENFDINKEMIKSNIKREMENPNNFSFKKYAKLLGASNPYHYSLAGKLEDLDKINSKNLYSYYKAFFKDNNIDIIVLGDICFKSIEEIFDKSFKIKGKRENDTDIYLSYQKPFTEDIIPSKFNQSKLIMGGNINKLNSYEKKYVSLIYNIILGNSPKSKLFQNVREKNSFAYSIWSNFNGLDGLFLIGAGISKSNYDNTKKEIIKQMNEMRKGKFTDADINNAKAFLKMVIEESDDYQSSIADRYFNNLYFDADPKEKQLELIDKIDKKSVIDVANKIEIDTILLVEEKI